MLATWVEIYSQHSTRAGRVDNQHIDTIGCCVSGMRKTAAFFSIILLILFVVTTGLMLIATTDF